MLELADILRRHGSAYRAQHSLLPSQQRVFEDLVRCRTAACGGQLYRCDHCGSEHYSYHSCGNRHCPKCHGQQTERWLQKQQEAVHYPLQPSSSVLSTFTSSLSACPFPRIRLPLQQAPHLSKRSPHASSPSGAKSL